MKIHHPRLLFFSCSFAGDSIKMKRSMRSGFAFEIQTETCTCTRKETNLIETNSQIIFTLNCCSFPFHEFSVMRLSRTASVLGQNIIHFQNFSTLFIIWHSSFFLAWSTQFQCKEQIYDKTLDCLKKYLENNYQAASQIVEFLIRAAKITFGFFSKWFDVHICEPLGERTPLLNWTAWPIWMVCILRLMTAIHNLPIFIPKGTFFTNRCMISVDHFSSKQWICIWDY